MNNPGYDLYNILAIILPALTLTVLLINIALVAPISSWRLRKKRVESRTRVGLLPKKEIEPFQLQLLCQYIEDKVLQQQEAAKANAQIVVKEEDFGGEKGMQRILQAFYHTQIRHLKPKNRRGARKLCEKGLISTSGRRLSLDEEIIAEQYKVSPETLSALIDFRLLRAVPRLGSYYYEISHDTLIKPILNAVKQRQGRRRYSVLLVGVPLLVLWIAFEGYNRTLELEGFEARATSISRSDTLTVTEKVDQIRLIYDRLSGRFKHDIYRIKSRIEGRVQEATTIHSPANFFTFKRFSKDRSQRATDPLKIPQGATDQFQVQDTVYVWAIISAPHEGPVTFRWYDGEGKVTAERTIEVPRTMAYRVWQQASDVRVGKNEVRLYNSGNYLIGRKVFYVRSD